MDPHIEACRVSAPREKCRNGSRGRTVTVQVPFRLGRVTRFPFALMSDTQRAQVLRQDAKLLKDTGKGYEQLAADEEREAAVLERRHPSCGSKLLWGLGVAVAATAVLYGVRWMWRLSVRKETETPVISDEERKGRPTGGVAGGNSKPEETWSMDGRVEGSLEIGKIVKSRNGRYFMTVQPNGALSIYKGSGSTDPEAQLIWTTGRYANSGYPTGIVLQPNFNVCLSLADTSEVGWCSHTDSVFGARQDAMGIPYLQLTDDGALELRGTKQPSEVSPVFLTPVKGLNGFKGEELTVKDTLGVGDWIRSPDRQRILIQGEDGRLRVYRATHKGDRDATLEWESNPVAKQEASDWWSGLFHGRLVTFEGPLGDTTKSGAVRWTSGNSATEADSVYVRLRERVEIWYSHLSPKLLWISPLPLRTRGLAGPGSLGPAGAAAAGAGLTRGASPTTVAVARRPVAPGGPAVPVTRGTGASTVPRAAGAAGHPTRGHPTGMAGVPGPVAAPAPAVGGVGGGRPLASRAVRFAAPPAQSR